ncbi:hypothetical protein EOD39_13255 [Acipenser ruthenus]|uniref:Uncharacterized protein n=1 Tax=Acipenser ruthenus TaxID=7906 RepID=A0A662YPD9_ACIRT|nr:hypothetical protein EOD39_13255 [Acipenser ruthenus]
MLSNVELRKKNKKRSLYVFWDPLPATDKESLQGSDEAKAEEFLKGHLYAVSMQNAVPVVNHKTEDHTEEEANAQEQETILNISYELAAEASKRSKLVAALVQQYGSTNLCACEVLLEPTLILFLENNSFAFADVMQAVWCGDLEQASR